MYAHILLTADGSLNAVRAANEAIKFASENTLIEIVYVADFNHVKTDVLHNTSSESLLIERRKKVAPIIQLLKESSIQHKFTILHGLPAEEIIKYANEKQVDLVVMGSRGLNGLQEMLIGSVSHKVIKHVKCPALIVK